jgi:hypothetical protein
LLHVPLAQKSPGQHCCPEPPHATQLPLWQSLSGCVHPIPPVQHAWPIFPQAPASPWQPPALQVPLFCGQFPPLAMHVPLF